MKNVLEMTKKELQKLPHMEPKSYFNSIVIVPMNYIHESGFQCMKFILLNTKDTLENIVGVVGGGSDVVHINGIGGYGKNMKYIEKGRRGYSWSIDCLPKSKCLRLFTDEKLECDDMVFSDFIFYVKEEKE